MARTVGGVVGAVVGFWVGGPTGAQWGWMLGSAVGGSFETIKAPKMGDLAQVSAGEGSPRARVYGTFRPIGGQIVWAGKPRVIKRKQRAGKGAPKQETNVVLRSYAIGICEGPITSVSRIWRNNELVYDVRPGSQILAQSAEWLQGKQILLGGWDQMPHPTIEAAEGVGNAPAMRGTALLVVTDEETPGYNGGIPSYQFEVRRAVGRTLTTPPYQYEFSDSVGVYANARDAELRNIGYITDASDEAEVFASVVSASLGELLQSVDYSESIDIGVSANIELNSTIKSIDYMEMVDVSSSIHAAELRRVVIQYDNWPQEEINVSATIESAYLGS